MVCVFGKATVWNNIKQISQLGRWIIPFPRQPADINDEFQKAELTNRKQFSPGFLVYSYPFKTRQRRTSISMKQTYYKIIDKIFKIVCGFLMESVYECILKTCISLLSLSLLLLPLDFFFRSDILNCTRAQKKNDVMCQWCCCELFCVFQHSHMEYIIYYHRSFRFFGWYNKHSGPQKVMGILPFN